MTGTATPSSTQERVTSLDFVRGVATLGILVMNAVSHALPQAAYFNLDAAGSDTWLDWTIGVAGEIFVDQKTMALFSLLFGAGIVLFADRAEAKGRRPVRLSLWRNFLLLLIGLAHSAIWFGDVLVVYAVCSPLLLAMRKKSARTVIVTGTALVVGSAVIGAVTQLTIPENGIGADGTGLGDYWFVDATIGIDTSMSDAVGIFLLCDFFFRAAGMMLIGVGLYRLGIVQGSRDDHYYRRMAAIGLAIGLPLATIGPIWQLVAEFDPSIAIVSSSPNTLATIPLSLAYMSILILVNERIGAAAERFRAVGRMALTNYLTQTLIAVALFSIALDQPMLDQPMLDQPMPGRTAIAGFVLCVWVLQLVWSKPWLDRFRYGPFEWLWRSATYRSWQPLRKQPR